MSASQFANRFSIGRNDFNTRIEFWEDVSGSQTARPAFAVTLCNVDADELGKLLVQVKEQNDAKKGTKQ